MIIRSVEAEIEVQRRERLLQERALELGLEVFQRISTVIDEEKSSLLLIIQFNNFKRILFSPTKCRVIISV